MLTHSLTRVPVATWAVCPWCGAHQQLQPASAPRGWAADYMALEPLVCWDSLASWPCMRAPCLNCACFVQRRSAQIPWLFVHLRRRFVGGLRCSTRLIASACTVLSIGLGPQWFAVGMLWELHTVCTPALVSDCVHNGRAELAWICTPVLHHHSASALCNGTVSETAKLAQLCGAPSVVSVRPRCVGILHPLWTWALQRVRSSSTT